MPYAWIITKDRIADNDAPEATNANAKGLMGWSGDNGQNRWPDHAAVMADERKERFSLYDDGGKCYYEGYMVITGKALESEDAAFAPLSWGTYNAGCSYMKVPNKHGEMEIL